MEGVHSPSKQIGQKINFGFALSAHESLERSPYNQPAKYLADIGVRVFSLDLPAHGPDLKAVNAVGIWAKEFEKGRDPLSPFLEKIHFALDALMEKGLLIREKIGLMGLSRGGLITCLFLAGISHKPRRKVAQSVMSDWPKDFEGNVCKHCRESLFSQDDVTDGQIFPGVCEKCRLAQYEIRATVCFAPLTELTFAREFKKLKEIKLAKTYNLSNHIDALCEKNMRFYMGNRDICVGTDICYDLAWKLANTAFEKGIRSPPIELIISPSIGHLGHGTSKEVFESGANWLGKMLGAIK